MMRITLKQGDDVLLIEEYRDEQTAVTTLTLAEIAEYCRDKPAVLFCETDDSAWQIAYTFERTTELLYATAVVSKADRPSKTYRNVVCLAHWLPPYGEFRLDREEWVMVSNAKPIITRAGLPRSYVPLGSGEAYTGFATLIGEDYDLDWGLCRMPDNTHRVFLRRELERPVPPIHTPEQAYLVADLVDAV